MRRARTLTVAVLATALCAPAAEAKHRHHGRQSHHQDASAPARGCDRACLTGLAERYMDAMVARTPAVLPWAQPNRLSENAVALDVGDGLWGTISGHGQPVLEAADPATGQAAWFGVVQEHGQPAFLALRLKAEDGKITEVETVVRRKGGPPRARLRQGRRSRPSPSRPVACPRRGP